MLTQPREGGSLLYGKFWEFTHAINCCFRHITELKSLLHNKGLITLERRAKQSEVTPKSLPHH